ncbi:hypothetical protein EGT74_26860 [Chitinophaga lutea]|uniref:Glycosyltransferase n=1 Tax=Chitinophaga lutea TaxID=2488634 RepID=A0A3N4Q2H6_9BACT|nr:hypothetical protein [Chitinophaga lutea]RPE05974.1 hypothetical protein EGT74_26860 [Chitinophaga lutea]
MFFRKKHREQSLFKIFSFYNQHVNPDVPVFQKAVFEKFGFSINHVFDKRFSHGDFLNHMCRNVTDTDYLICFDIDCIPTTPQWMQLLLNDLLEPRTIVGAAQTANHLRDAKNLYVSPFFFAISTAYLKELNYPDMNMTADMDAGQNLTERILAGNGQVKYWWPTHIEEEKWYLHHPEHNKFGLGTTYNDAIYHAFYSRDNISARFIEKCRAVLEG